MTEAKSAAPAEPGPELLTTEEACERLNVSRSTLLRWARKHRVKRVKRGRSKTGLVRWPVAELDRLVNESLREVR
jgi:excisionase family DNA binding protein